MQRRDNEDDTVEFEPVRSQDVTVFNRDIALFILACIVLLGAIVLTAMQIDIPTWLVVAVSNIVVFYFGLQIQGNRS